MIHAQQGNRSALSLMPGGECLRLDCAPRLGDHALAGPIEWGLSATLSATSLVATVCVPSDRHVSVMSVCLSTDGGSMQVWEHNPRLPRPLWALPCHGVRPSPGSCRSLALLLPRQFGPQQSMAAEARITPTTPPEAPSEPKDPGRWMGLARVPARNAMRCGRCVPCCVHCICMVVSNLWLLKRPCPQIRVLRRPRIMASGGPAVLL